MDPVGPATGAPSGVREVGGAGGEAEEGSGEPAGGETGAAVGVADGVGVGVGVIEGVGAAVLGGWAGDGRGDLVGAGPGAWAMADEAMRARKSKTTTDFEAIVFVVWEKWRILFRAERRRRRRGFI